MIKEAVILAGGFGTRLKDTIPDLPKCLAPVRNKPFISYVIDYLLNSGVNRIVFSLYYKSELVIEYLKNHWNHIDYDYVVERQPLGTGGALKLALNNVKSDNVFLINGDSFFNIELNKLLDFHVFNGAEFTIALKSMTDVSRYGTVEIDSLGKVIAFNEKNSSLTEGLINGGIYVVNSNCFKLNKLESVFSLESDYLMTNTTQKKIFGMIFEDYFIDIGVPADYQKANNEL